MNQVYDYRASGTFSTFVFASAALITSGSAGASLLFDSTDNGMLLADLRGAERYYGLAPDTTTGRVGFLVNEVGGTARADAGVFVIAPSGEPQKSIGDYAGEQTGAESIKQRLEAMASSDWFKKTYQNKSIAPVIDVNP